MRLSTQVFSEWLGTTLLLAVVVGSGIMAESLAAGNLAVALLANTLATVFGLWTLIEVFRPISGAHFNPAVSMVMALRRELPLQVLPAFVVAQLFGAACGTWLAHAMFELPAIQLSTHVRTGNGQWLAEVVATAGLILVILRGPTSRVPGLVAAWIGAAYWFTASTSFANPAAVFGRMFSDTFAGVSPDSATAFLLAEFVGASVGLAAHRMLSTSHRL